MGTALFIGGVVIMTLAIILSIALHEIGHLVPAKLFNVRVPQYMIGFGSTIFSRKVGETEYGIKAIPLGGYISMIGMYPPASKTTRHNRLSQIYQDARDIDAERITPKDEGRLFYQLPVYKRIIIMLGGPTMNLLIGVLCMAVLILGFGKYQPTTTIETISQCVHTVTATNADQANRASCTNTDLDSPAHAAGLTAGDTITVFAGEQVTSWEQLTSLIQRNANHSVPVTVEKDGKTRELTITPLETVRPVYNQLTGQYEKNPDGTYKTITVGFIGVSPTSELTPGHIGQVLPEVGNTLERIGATVLKLPARVFSVGESLITGSERPADSPVSVVGVGRAAGEIAATDRIDLRSKSATLISLIGSMNLMLFVFNLIPLLPLDGGHVAGALWEGLRKGWARLRGKANPGPFDPVKLLPLTWVVAGAFILMSVVLILADIIKPINLF
ncbi:M50 family metallopeptidase [Rothia sp. P7208]|uniref:M50 family metallopeptidase n=1 Tax=Rothia sp. P7208 TaxID=3402660 RepID=UPI003ACB669F